MALSVPGMQRIRRESLLVAIALHDPRIVVSLAPQPFVDGLDMQLPNIAPVRIVPDATEELGAIWQQEDDLLGVEDPAPPFAQAMRRRIDHDPRQTFRG